MDQIHKLKQTLSNPLPAKCKKCNYDYAEEIRKLLSEKDSQLLDINVFIELYIDSHSQPLHTTQN